MPVFGRIFPAPLAAKVPEIIALFWVVKILTTGGRGGHVGLPQDLGKHQGWWDGSLSVRGRSRALSSPLAGTGLSPIGSWPFPSPFSGPGSRTSSTSTSNSLRRDHAPVGGHLGGIFLDMEPQRGNALHPQHHDPTT